ncbi:MAG TPA: VOC family protein [Burkholderiales bacterium]|nr:VOC family protein [Burkholderiales bacterium]
MNTVATARYDRATENVGNVVHLEHVNLTQPDQRLATLFYVVGLGGTRDPYLMVGTGNMWVNFGRTQMHLPTRGAQRLRGRIGFVVPELGALAARLKRVAPELAGSGFAWREAGGAIEATCPWGNRIRCHAPAPEFGATELGLAYLELDAPQGSAAAIARFYRDVLRAPARVEPGRALVAIGRNQHLAFVETEAPLADYDGHHIQIYLADFSAPYLWLRERGLITLEPDAHEWRFQWIVDPADGRRLYQLEHEVRSMKHPLFGRPLVNRDPGISNATYVPGCDDLRARY